jgi:protein-tyrosine kinase
MPGGAIPPNPLELVSRPVFTILMRELTAKFDYVLVDTPAAIYGSDAQAIASACGAALIVARKDKSRVSALQEQLAALSIGRAQLAGVILNEF